MERHTVTEPGAVTPDSPTFQFQPGGSRSASVKSEQHFPKCGVLVIITWGNVPLDSPQLSLDRDTFWWKTFCPAKPFDEFGGV